MRSGFLGSTPRLLLMAALAITPAPIARSQPIPTPAPGPTPTPAAGRTSVSVPQPQSLSAPQPQSLPYQNPDTAQLVELVEAAAREVGRRGEASFPEFRVKGGRWFQGDRYVFVLDPGGGSPVYPPEPSSEGTNFLNFQDLTGRPFGRMIVERGTSAAGRGWVHYQWRRPNPDDRRAVWKSTYVVAVTAPSGKSFLVAAGLYDLPMEKAFVVQEVEAAADLLRREGRAAFTKLRDPLGRFHFQDTYVFVDTADGVELVNPAFPEVEGRNLLDLRDEEGQPMVRQYLRVALEQGSGWTRYLWPRPESPRLPARKSTYVRAVTLPDGEILVVGSGLYEP